MTSQPSRYAILIGINAYNQKHAKRLRGCVRDVDEIAKKLKQSVPNVHIYRFTASVNPDRGADKPTEEEEEWPTYDKITSCLDEISGRAQPGDHVYIHYSGHGTAQPASDDPSQKSLALVLLDGTIAEDIRYFPSIELAQRMHAMVKRGLGVTVSLDCCFSGSTRRNDSPMRYVDYLPEIAEKYPSRDEEVSDRDTRSNKAGVKGSRRFSLAENWLLDPNDYAILAAGDAAEISFEVKFDGSGETLRHGALSFFLINAFDILGVVGGSMRELHESITMGVQGNRRNREKSQSPILLGNDKQLFFGCHGRGYSGDIPISKCVDDGKTELRLHAGKAHGISEHDEFTLHPIGMKESIADGNEFAAEAARIYGVTSDLRLTKGDFATIETGWLATATTRFSLRQFPIKFNVPDNQIKDWREGMQRRKSLKEFEEGADPSWVLQVTQLNDREYEIQDASGKVITTVTVTSDELPEKQQILNQIQHLASFRLVRCLVNSATDEDASTFRKLFSCQIFQVVGGKRIFFNPGCLKTRDTYNACFHPECVLKTNEEDKVTVLVTNLSDTTGPKLHLYVYAMGSKGEIKNALRATRDVVPPKNDDPDERSPGTWKLTLQLTLEDGQTECEDILKVFITAQPTSFSALELPNLGHLPSHGEPKFDGMRPERGEKSKRKPEDWAVFTFRIRVVRRLP